MLADFIQFIKQENLFAPKDKILLGVSGGIDSVVMADLFFKAGYDFGIGHCNFGLRGKESDEDNDFVKQLANQCKVPFYATKFDTLLFATDQSVSIQMAARDLRINWFEEIIKEHGYSFYATAHHLDDQIETVLYNFFRGTGISGLHGILPKRNSLIHPMLFCYRKQIESYARDHQLIYREDSSNEKTHYARNKIRHQLNPAIKKIFPNYQQTITDNIERFRKVETIYRNLIQKEMEGLLEDHKDDIRIPVDKLQNLQPTDMYLYELIKPYGFNYQNAKDILKSMHAGSGKYFLSGTHRITIDRNYLILEKYERKATGVYFIEKGQKLIDDPINLKIGERKYTANILLTKESNTAQLDAENISYPLMLRKWQMGDWFYPLGMKNKKLVSDYFIDNKISMPEKEKIWLLLSEDRIVWIIGHRIDNRFKITSSTKTILTIQCDCY